MPILLDGAAGLAVFRDHCAVEEADALLDWLRRTEAPAADFGACTHLHTALLQLLLAARVRIVAPPADAILTACLTGGDAAAVAPAASRAPDTTPPAAGSGPARRKVARRAARTRETSA